MLAQRCSWPSRCIALLLSSLGLIATGEARRGDVRWMMRGELRDLGLVFGLFAWGFFRLGRRRLPRKAHANTCAFLYPQGGFVGRICLESAVDGPILATDGIPNAALLDRWWRDLGISEHITNDHSSRQKYLRRQIPRGRDARGSRRRGAAATRFARMAPAQRQRPSPSPDLNVWPLFYYIPRRAKVVPPLGLSG